MLRLVINAVNLAEGGGLTGLLGYLRAWREIEASLEVAVLASRPAVLEQVQGTRPDVTLHPFAVDVPAGRRLLLQRARLRREIDRMAPDVVLSTNMLAGGCAAPQVVHHRNLLIYEHRGVLATFAADRRAFLQLVLARRALAHAQANVFISDYLRGEAERFVPRSRPRNHVIYNGLSSSVIAAADEPSTWRGEPHLLALTSDHPHKRNRALVRLMAGLVDREPDVPWSMTVASAGDLPAEQKLAHELGVGERIEWPGFVSEAQVDRLFRRSLCLVFPTVLEGFGNPPLEAMARRCPVVSTNCTAIPEVVGPAGILVRPDRRTGPSISLDRQCGAVRGAVPEGRRGPGGGGRRSGTGMMPAFSLL
jgi:glycosyltransferase involved in cell wall biosynthesis